MSQKKWTLADIQQITGLPTETLRYVLDTQVVPWLNAGKAAASFQHGRGNPRTFARREATGVGIGGRMVGGGLQGSLVVECLRTLYHAPLYAETVGEATLLQQLLKQPKIVALEVCEPGHVRLISGPPSEVQRAGW